MPVPSSPLVVPQSEALPPSKGQLGWASRSPWPFSRWSARVSLAVWLAPLGLLLLDKPFLGDGNPALGLLRQKAS